MKQAPWVTGGSVRVNGPALRHLRLSAGRSLKSLAGPAGVSVSFIAQVERGDRPGCSAAVFDVLVAELGLRDPRVLMRDYEVQIPKQDRASA